MIFSRLRMGGMDLRFKKGEQWVNEFKGLHTGRLGISKRHIPSSGL